MNNRRYNSDRPSNERYQERFRDRYDDSRYDNYQGRSSEDRDWHGYNNAEAADNRRGPRNEERYGSDREHSYFLENRNPGFQSDFNDFDSSPDRGLMSRDRGMGRGMNRGMDRGVDRNYDRADYSASQYSAYGSDDYRRNASDTMDDWGSRRDWSRREDQSRDLGHNESRSGGLMNAVKSFFGKGPKGYKRSDERIKEDISEALYRHPRIDASDIEVDVKEGNVTLQGTVESREVKRLAEDLIEDCIGVVNVSNHLRVAQSSYGPGSNLRSGSSSSQNMSGQATGESLSTDKKGKSLQ